MTTVQKSQHRRTSHSNLFQSATNSEIPSRRYQPFLQRRNRLRSPPRLVINLGKVQIQLRVVMFHPQCFTAQRFRVAKSFLSQRREQSCIRKVKRVLRRDTERASRMLQSLLGLSVPKILQTLLEIVHSRIGGWCGSGSV